MKRPVLIFLFLLSILRPTFGQYSFFLSKAQIQAAEQAGYLEPFEAKNLRSALEEGPLPNIELVSGLLQNEPLGRGAITVYFASTYEARRRQYEALHQPGTPHRNSYIDPDSTLRRQKALTRELHEFCYRNTLVSESRYRELSGMIEREEIIHPAVYKDAVQYMWWQDFTIVPKHLELLAGKYHEAGWLSRRSLNKLKPELKRKGANLATILTQLDNVQLLPIESVYFDYRSAGEAVGRCLHAAFPEITEPEIRLGLKVHADEEESFQVGGRYFNAYDSTEILPDTVLELRFRHQGFEFRIKPSFRYASVAGRPGYDIWSYLQSDDCNHLLHQLATDRGNDHNKLTIQFFDLADANNVGLDHAYGSRDSFPQFRIVPAFMPALIRQEYDAVREAGTSINLNEFGGSASILRIPWVQPWMTTLLPTTRKHAVVDFLVAQGLLDTSSMSIADLRGHLGALNAPGPISLLMQLPLRALPYNIAFPPLECAKFNNPRQLLFQPYFAGFSRLTDSLFVITALQQRVAGPDRGEISFTANKHRYTFPIPCGEGIYARILATAGAAMHEAGVLPDRHVYIWSHNAVDNTRGYAFLMTEQQHDAWKAFFGWPLERADVYK